MVLELIFKYYVRQTSTANTIVKTVLMTVKYLNGHYCFVPVWF